VIRVRRGRVSIRGKLPLAVHDTIRRFLLDDVAPRGRVTISGRRRGGRLELRFRGALESGDRQRIRNFLLTSGI
jgi:hypothetical protein